MDNLETNTKILEQCRLDMDNLAGLGAAGMDEAVAKAEKRARSCGQELRQAAKAVELTAKQKKTVEDARLAGEEKLSAAVQDEEDARIAAETVRKMIEDAASVRGSSNKDTAKILERAETVLDETLNRADQFYTEKKAQREEIENAMLRLYATEKAVLYTMAKAERNEGEKLLNKVLAEKKHAVCAAEYEVLLLNAKEAELQEQADSHQDSVQQLEAEMIVANAQVEESIKLQQKVAADLKQQLQTCEAECSAAIELLSGEQTQCRERYLTAETELEVAKGLLQDSQAEEMDRRELLAQAQTQSRDTIADARKQYEQSLAEQDRQLAVYEEAVKHSRASLDDAIAKQGVAEGEAERLRKLAEDFSLKAADAEAEELSAREAAATANRLAENAIKIRESISSESSQLLFHAQEVLMEAAASAQQLMDEKSLMRAAAQNESDRISKQATLAENTVRQAEELVEIKKASFHESEMQLEQAGIAAENKKAELQAKMEQQVAAAEEMLHNAAAAAEQAAVNVVEAIDQRDQAQLRLEELGQELENVTQRLDEARSTGAERQKELQDYVDRENARLAEEHRLAIAKAADLESKRDREQGILSSLHQDISDILTQIDVASAQVEDVISAGAEEIEEAEIQLQQLTEAEQTAHLVAEEAVGKMSFASQQLLGAAESTSLSNLADLIVEPESPVSQPEPEMLFPGFQAFSEESLVNPEPQVGLAEEEKEEILINDVLPSTETPLESPSESPLGEEPAAPQPGSLSEESWMDQASFFLSSVADAASDDFLVTEEPAMLFENPVVEEEELPLIQEEEAAVPAAAENPPAEAALIPEEAQPEAMPAPETEVVAAEEIPEEKPLIPEEEKEEAEEKPLITEEEPVRSESQVFSFVDSLLASEMDAGPDFPGVEAAIVQPAPQPQPEPAPLQEEEPAPLAKEPQNQEEVSSPAPEDKPLIQEEEIPEETTSRESSEEPEVDEVAQAVRKAVSEAAARMTPMEDGDQPYDAKELTAEISPMLEQDMERTGSWKRQEMTEEELEYTMHLEDVSARLLEHTIIPLEEENTTPHLYQPSDWLANLTRSLGEESTETEEKTKGEATKPTGSEINLDQLLGKENGGEGAATVPDGQIKMPELELPPMDEGPRWKRQEEEKSSSPKKRRFLFFN